MERLLLLPILHDFTSSKITMETLKTLEKVVKFLWSELNGYQIDLSVTNPVSL